MPTFQWEQKAETNIWGDIISKVKETSYGYVNVADQVGEKIACFCVTGVT